MQLYVLITNDCNLNCSICIRANSAAKTQEMSLEAFKEMLQSNNFEEDDLIITGGEPTKHKQFSDIVKYACENVNNVYVTTNGTMDYYINDLSDYDNLSFQVSLDGDELSNDLIRGTGVYAKICRTLGKFEEVGINYSVASVVSKKNIESIKNLIPSLSGLRIMKYWRISYEMPFGNAGFEDMLLADEWNNFVDEMIKKARCHLKIKKIYPLELYDKRIRETETLKVNNKRSNNCGSGRDKLYIYPDLNVYSCTCLSDFSLGSLNKLSLNEIKNGTEINKFKNYEIELDIPCNDCRYLLFCNGGCIGMSYHYFGKLGKGDIRCPILRRYYEEKGVLL